VAEHIYRACEGNARLRAHLVTVMAERDAAIDQAAALRPLRAQRDAYARFWQESAARAAGLTRETARLRALLAAERRSWYGRLGRDVARAWGALARLT
jgi:hypothetical protein